MTLRSRFWAVVGLTGLAFGLRSVGLTFQSLWRDEVDAVRFATRPLPELLATFVTPGENGPLYYLSLGPWLRLAGHSEYSLRFFSVACGVIAVPLIYRLAHRFFPDLPLVPLIAAALATTSPYLVWYSQEGKMYALVTVLVLLSMDRFLASIQSNRWYHWVSYATFTVAAFYVHLIAVLIVPAQVLAYLLFQRQGFAGRKKAGLKALAAVALLVAVYIPLLAWQVPLLLRPGWSGFSFVPLHRMLAILLSTYSLGVLQTAVWWMLVPFVVLLLAAGEHLTRRAKHRASVGTLFSWLLAPAVILFVVCLRRPTFTSRYLVYVLPALLLLVTAGAAAVSRRSRLLAATLLASILVLNIWGLARQARTLFKADFRSATAYVAPAMLPSDLLLFQIPHGRHSFEYYYPRFESPPNVTAPVVGEYRVCLPFVAGGGRRAFHSRDGLYSNAGMTPAEAARRMAQLVAGHRVVWLVESESALWDERGLVKAWLDENAVLTDEVGYTRVTVYRYELTGLSP